MAAPFLAPILLEKSDTYLPEYPRTLGNIKQRVAKTLGGSNSSAILDLAEEGVLRAVDDINMRHYLRFGIQSPVSTALTAGTAAYDIPADTFNVQEVQLYDSDGNPYRTLEYLDWGEFNRIREQQTATGVPSHCTARNAFADGEIEVYPTPDAGAAAAYTLRITAIERLDRPTADDSIIAAPREIQDVLITYAEYYVLSVRHRDQYPLWGHKERQYREKLAAFVRMIHREPSERLRFRLDWDADPQPRTYDPLG